MCFLQGISPWSSVSKLKRLERRATKTSRTELLVDLGNKKPPYCERNLRRRLAVAVSKPRETPRAAEQPSRFSKGAALFHAQRRSSFFSNPRAILVQGAENLDVSAGVQNSDKMGCGNSGMDGWAKKNTLSMARKGDLGGHETLPKKQCTIFEGNHSKLLQKSALSLIPPVSIGWSKEMRRLKTFNS